MVLQREFGVLLKDWLSAEQLSVSEFAVRIDRTAEAVRRYVTGERIPDRETMPKIAVQTSGAVTANDFFGIADADHGDQSEASLIPASHGKADQVSASVAA